VIFNTKQCFTESETAYRKISIQEAVKIKSNNNIMILFVDSKQKVSFSIPLLKMVRITAEIRRVIYTKLSKVKRQSGFTLLQKKLVST